MENIIVGVVVAVALVFSVRSVSRIYKGKAGCGCGDICARSTRAKACCSKEDILADRTWVECPCKSGAPNAR